MLCHMILNPENDKLMIPLWQSKDYGSRFLMQDFHVKEFYNLDVKLKKLPILSYFSFLKKTKKLRGFLKTG